jgi:hypothetical protein
MLRTVKIAHTAIWVFFVLAIGAIWVFAVRGKITAAACAIGIVLIEVVVLGFNHG